MSQRSGLPIRFSLHAGLFLLLSANPLFAGGAAGSGSNQAIVPLPDGSLTAGAAARLSPDGKLVATGDLEVVLSDAATGQLVRKLPFSDRARTIAFSPDGRLLVVGAGDN